MNKTQALYSEAKQIIPGGTQLLSKRPELFAPGVWPAYYSKASGCDIWDLDGNKFTDMSYMGLGSCILGYADKDVNAAVQKSILSGSMSTLNCPEEVVLANLLCDLHPWADMVRYARTGGEAMSVAVRIARAKTGKDVVLFCGYHGWNDWYLAANLHDDLLSDHLLPGLPVRGVPKDLGGTAVPFKYNDLDDFAAKLKKYKDQVGAIVMEPTRYHSPEEGFLEAVRNIASECGIVLIFDEITMGWRITCGGSHLVFGVNPDIAVFAKGMSNGFPMAAVIGSSDVMSFAQDTFISSTFWTERIGPVAAIASISKMSVDVINHLNEMGRQVQEGWKIAAEKRGVGIMVYGQSALSHFDFGDNSLTYKTAFTRGMLKKGFLADCAYYASYAHRQNHVDRYLQAVDEVFAELEADALAMNTKDIRVRGLIRK